MPEQVIPVRVIPVPLGDAEPLAAAARFHAEYLPEIEDVLAGGSGVILQFGAAEEKPHRWRKEALAALARKYAPLRVNGVSPLSGGDNAALQAAIDFLSGNEGVTGQLVIAG